MIVLAAGGGGVPVAESPTGTFTRVDAVIDKDLAAARVAAGLGAQALLLITAVDEVYVDFGTPRARAMRVMDTRWRSSTWPRASSRRAAWGRRSGPRCRSSAGRARAPW